MSELPDVRYHTVRAFTKTLHHSPNEATDPNHVTLASGFSVCIIGASTGIGEHIAYAYAHAKTTSITIASRNLSALTPVADKIKSISPSTTVHISTCDISSYDSVAALATHVSQTHPSGLDCIVTVPASSPPFSANIAHDSPALNAAAFLTNTVGTMHVAKAFIPLLLAKPAGAKAFLAVASLGATLVRGFAAQPAYNTSKLAEIRIVEYLSEQFAHEDLLALSIHPGSVLTRMSAQYCPKEFQHVLKDDPGLCGAVCVWVSKQTRQLKWLSGRFVSANWDVEELVRRKGEIVEGDKLKLAMVV